MEINLYLLLSLLIALLVISYLLGKLYRVRGQLFLIRDALNDIKAGNLNRRVLTRESDLTKQICYDINEIAMSSQSRLIQQKQSEQAYKRLMTSLSHDVKTPLASLVGYLEAVESKMVTGAEKEEYIRVAMEKAHHLKDFVTALFEWVKLDAGEQIFHFEVCDLNELSRGIMADWVPLLENHDLSYEIEIPETEYMTRVDSTAYTRILNNLLQNILTHSDASKVFLTVTETEQQAKIVVADNGNGIAASDLPHIFERMYQCDHSRSAKGNGLGLSIAKELVSIHKGTITAASVPGNGTTFILLVFSLCACQQAAPSSGEAPDQQAITEEATEYFNQMMDGDFETFFNALPQGVQDNISAETIQETWEEEVDKLGGLPENTSPDVSCYAPEHSDQIRVEFVIPCDKGNFKVFINYFPDGSLYNYVIWKNETK